MQEEALTVIIINIIIYHILHIMNGDKCETKHMIMKKLLEKKNHKSICIKFNNEALNMHVKLILQFKVRMN